MLELDDLASLDLDVASLALEATRELVQQDARARQRHPLSGRSCCEQQGGDAHRDAHPDRLHVGPDELHRVVDAEPGVDRAARRIDVEKDVLVGVVRLQVQQLGDDHIRDLVVDRRSEEDDALREQARVDVEGTFATSALLDDRRDHRAHSLLRRSARCGQPTEPSIWIWISRFISIAYSSGSSLTIGSMKPETIKAEASASEIPRDMR